MKNEVLNLLRFNMLSEGEHKWLYAYMLLFIPYAFTSGFVDPLLALGLVIFVAAPLSPSFLIFVFYMLWEFVTTFSFGVTVVLLMQLIMVGKLVVNRALFKQFAGITYRKVRSLFLFLFGYMLVVGMISFILGNGLTGLGFFFKVTIVSYVLTYYVSDSSFDKLLKNVLQVLMISSILATIYGMTHELVVERWVSEMGGYINQIKGTLGTTRMAFFYLTSIIFFLYYVTHPIVKYLGLICFTALTLMNVSLTAMALLLVIFFIYFFSIGQIYKAVLYTMVSVAIAIVTFPLWSRMDLVQPIIFRTMSSFKAIMNGDVNTATSNREDLGDFYIKSWENSNPLIQMFGNANTATSVTSNDAYSHNTYLDILFFFGVVGIILLMIYQARRLWLSRHSIYFYPYLTIKVLFILGSASVSVMSATYYVFMIFL